MSVQNDEGLSEDRTGSVKAQDQNGCIMITLPADVARDLDISKGDTVLVHGEKGDRKATVGKPSDLIER